MPGPTTLLRHCLVLLLFALYQLVVHGGIINARQDARDSFLSSPLRGTRSLLRVREVNPDVCLHRIQTRPWTECEDFVGGFNMTMAEFVEMNPAVDTDCYGWQGGAEYCVDMRTCDTEALEQYSIV